MRNNRFSGDIVGHVPGDWRGIRAYGVVGVEYDLFSPTSAAQTLAKTQGFAFAPSAKLSSQGKPGFNAGAGIDYKVASKVDLRLDVRDHTFGSPTYGLPQAATSAYSAFFPVGGPAHDIEYSMALCIGSARASEGLPRVFETLSAAAQVEDQNGVEICAAKLTTLPPVGSTCRGSWRG